jgi:hypothetical protein
MWNQVYDPFNNTTASTIAAALPVVTLLVLIASNKVKAHVAAIVTPRTRPVYWRMISIWHCLYTSILQLPDDATSRQLLRMFVDTPWAETTLPVHSLSLDLLPEPASSTKDAVRAYCKTYIEPKLNELLE